MARVLTTTADGHVLNRASNPEHIGAAMAGEPTPYYAFRDDDYEFSVLVRTLRREFNLARVDVISVPSRRIRLVDSNENTVHGSALRFLAEQGYYVTNIGVSEFKYLDGRRFPHAYAEFEAHSNAVRAALDGGASD